MNANAARKIQVPAMSDEFQKLRKLNAPALDRLFSEATTFAAKQALAHGVTVAGIDEHNRLVLTKHALRLTPLPVTPHDYASAK